MSFKLSEITNALGDPKFFLEESSNWSFAAHLLIVGKNFFLIGFKLEDVSLCRVDEDRFLILANEDWHQAFRRLGVSFHGDSVKVKEVVVFIKDGVTFQTRTIIAHVAIENSSKWTVQIVTEIQSDWGQPIDFLFFKSEVPILLSLRVEVAIESWNHLSSGNISILNNFVSTNNQIWQDQG